MTGDGWDHAVKVAIGALVLIGMLVGAAAVGIVWGLSALLGGAS